MQDAVAREAQDGVLDALCARAGIVCVIGAGGKKTTMYALARAHRGRVGVTTTVHIPPFPRDLGAPAVIAPAPDIERAVAAAAGSAPRLAYACVASKPGRHAGVPAGSIERIHDAAGFDLTLVKADGARRRLLKAAGAGEPCLTGRVDTVIAVASAQVVGAVLDQRLVHHVDLVAHVAQIAPGAVVGAHHVARVLANALQGLDLDADVHRVALINMADDPRRRAVAAEIAGEVLALAPGVQRAVVASMRAPQPILDTLER